VDANNNSLKLSGSRTACLSLDHREAHPDSRGRFKDPSFPQKQKSRMKIDALKLDPGAFD